LIFDFIIITESCKTWKNSINDLEKIRAFEAWGSKKALQGSNFTTTFRVLKVGGFFHFIYMQVYICAKEKLKLSGN